MLFKSVINNSTVATFLKKSKHNRKLPEDTWKFDLGQAIEKDTSIFIH